MINEETKQKLREQVTELTKELEKNSTDDKKVASILLKRAHIYKTLNEFDNATNDAKTALKKDASVGDQVKDILIPNTLQDMPEASAVDPLIDSFQKHLASLDNASVNHIRSLVSSNDFVLILKACGTPDTPARVKSLAFMILTKLFNPSSSNNDTKNYPLTFIIEQCAACFSHCIDQGKNDTKLLAYRTLLAIFQTSITVGSAILCQEGTMEEIMDTVEFETLPVQLAIAEVLNIAMGDKTCRKQILTYASDWLVRMVGGKNTDAQLKAVAGAALTKLRARAAEADADAATDGKNNGSGEPAKKLSDSLEDAMNRMHLTNSSLAEQLVQVVKSKSSDASLILNAIEGLAYSCLKPDIKELLGKDSEFVKCMSTLAINTTREEHQPNSNPLLFGIGSIFANLTMYRPVLDEQQKQMKKLRELAEAKQHQASGGRPTTTSEHEDPREDNNAVESRIKTCIANGAALALMVLSKNNSTNLRALAAQTYLQLITPPSTRGQLLQQGVVRSLLPLTHDQHAIPTPDSKTSTTAVLASQALAKLAITTDPRIAFQGDTLLDLVRPFLHNLCQDPAQLRQFEGLMALTNLASIDDRVRLLIESNEGMAVFENLQLSDNDMVQRAATEMVCNMTMCEPVFERYSDPKQSQNRIRLLMILSDHEDAATRRAASGALAILANAEGTGEMMMKVDGWMEKMVMWVEDETPDVQHRGIEVIRLLVEQKGKDVVNKLLQADMDKKLEALVKRSNVPVVKSLAEEVLSSIRKIEKSDSK